MSTNERPEEAGIDAAPEGASDEGRPDEDKSLRDEEQVRDPDAEQQDPESGSASMDG